MAIRIRCDCGKRYSVSESRAGSVVKCKECGAPIAVPGEILSQHPEVESSQDENFLNDLGSGASYDPDSDAASFLGIELELTEDRPPETISKDTAPRELHPFAFYCLGSVVLAIVMGIVFSIISPPATAEQIANKDVTGFGVGFMATITPLILLVGVNFGAIMSKPFADSLNDPGVGCLYYIVFGPAVIIWVIYDRVLGPISNKCIEFLMRLYERAFSPLHLQPGGYWPATKSLFGIADSGPKRSGQKKKSRRNAQFFAKCTACGVMTPTKEGWTDFYETCAKCHTTFKVGKIIDRNDSGS